MNLHKQFIFTRPNLFKTTLICINIYFYKGNPRGNPLIKNGKKNEEEVATEFLDCFELNYNLLTAVDNQNVTNVVSFEEFEYVSFLFDHDDDFVQMVNESWND